MPSKQALVSFKNHSFSKKIEIFSNSKDCNLWLDLKTMTMGKSEVLLFLKKIQIHRKWQSVMFARFLLCGVVITIRGIFESSQKKSRRLSSIAQDFMNRDTIFQYSVSNQYWRNLFMDKMRFYFITMLSPDGT